MKQFNALYTVIPVNIKVTKDIKIIFISFISIFDFIITNKYMYITQKLIDLNPDANNPDGNVTCTLVM